MIRSSLLFSLFCLDLLALTSCGGGNTPAVGDEAQADSAQANGADVANTREVLAEVDYNLILERPVIANTPVRQVEFGDLNVASGQIVVCDPLVLPDWPPFERRIPPGRYPVFAYIAETGKGGDRIALVELQLSAARANKWVMALHPGEDPATLTEPGDFFGFPVDAGLGGLYDLEAGMAYNRAIELFYKDNPEGNLYDDLFAAEFKKNATSPDDPGDWINYTLPGTGLNLLMFQSGWGDGAYPAYWGMTAQGEVVSLVIDFLIFDLKKAT